MKIHVYVEKEIEVSVSTEQIAEAIYSLPEPDRTHTLFTGINCFMNFMNQVKDEQVVALTEDQRKIIGKFFEQQSKRYLPAEQTK